VDVCPKKLNPNAAIANIKDLKIERAKEAKATKKTVSIKAI